MNSQWRRSIVVLTVIGMLAAVPAGYAWRGDEGPGSGPDKQCDWKRKGPERMFRDLGVTEEQKQKLKAQRETEMEQSKALRKELKTRMQALHDEIGKPDTDRAKVDAEVAGINTLKGQLFAQRINGLFTMKEILTPEQFAKFQEHHQKMMERRQHKWKRGGPEGVGGPEGPDGPEGPEGPEEGMDEPVS